VKDVFGGYPSISRVKRALASCNGGLPSEEEVPPIRARFPAGESASARVSIARELGGLHVSNFYIRK
jgi:hypothetical protein